jgi:hypothetical protein
MKLTYKLSFLIGLVLILSSFKSEETQFFVQFKINGIISPEQVILIDNTINSKEGVMVSRTDNVYNTFYCILAPNVDYSKEDFITWFDQLGYSISCFKKGIRLIDKPLSSKQLKNCNNG